MAVTPLLLTITAAFGASLSQVTLAATVYFLLYGVSQPLWGMMTDRFGRVRTLRLALAAAAVAAGASALAPTLGTLVAARGLAGLTFGAAVPTALIYVGDMVSIARRQSVLADLMSATAAGLAAATVVAGLVVDAIGWRAVFALPAVAALMLSFALGALLEPPSPPRRSTRGAIGSVLSRPWPLIVLALVAVEGMVAFGYLTFFAPALEASGVGPAMAGGILGVYGAAIVAWSRIVKRATRRLPSSTLIAIGAAMFFAGYLCATVDPGLAGIGVAAVLAAAGFAFMHSTLQTWATHVAPDLRATTVSLFVACLFLGGAVATALAAPLAGSGDFQAIFAVAALTSLPLGAAAVFASRRYDRRASDEPALSLSRS